MAQLIRQVLRLPELLPLTSIVPTQLSMLAKGTLTLSGGPNDVFIFQAGSGLNITNANIVLIGGLTPANVFWQVGSSAVLTAPVISFEGTIVALTSISMTNPVTMTGRALARNGAVTFDTDTVTVP